MAAQVFVAGFTPFFEEEVIQHSSADGNDEECQDVDDYGKDAVACQQRAEGLFCLAVAGLLSAQADDNGEGDDAQDIVNDGCTQDGVSGTGIQCAQLFQRLNGDADRSCSQHNADEDVLPEQLCHLRILFRVVEVCQEKAAYQRNDNAQQSDNEGGKACLFQFLDVGLQTGAEHEDDNAQFRQADDQVISLYHVQHHRAENDTGSQCAHDLWQADPLGQQSQQFRGQQDNCDLQ